MKKTNIFIADGLDQNIFDRLGKEESLSLHPKKKHTREELLEKAEEIELMVIRSATTVDKEIILAAKNLKAVIRAGEGTDNIDKKLCREKSIAVMNTPGANSASAAEHAISLMFTLLRKTWLAHASMKEGKWEKSKFTGMEISNKKIGIIGFGRIGQLVAKKLSGFDPEINFFDPHVEKTDFNAKKINNLEDLFKECDIITLHLPLNKATKNLITKAHFKSMKENAIFVNASRGGIVCEKDLLESLEKGKPYLAALDVFSQEPLEGQSLLRSNENLLLTPHLGASTNEAQERVGEMVFEQIMSFVKNNEVKNSVL